MPARSAARMKSISVLTQWATCGSSTDQRGAEQDDVVDVGGIGEGRRTGRVTRPAAHLVHDQLGAQRGERPADVTVTGVGVVVDEQDPPLQTQLSRGQLRGPSGRLTSGRLAGVR